MADQATVEWSCPKCSRHLSRPAERAGGMLSCRCNKVQRIPGIAEQSSATAWQLERIAKAFRWHLCVLVALPVFWLAAVAMRLEGEWVLYHSPASDEEATIIGWPLMVGAVLAMIVPLATDMRLMGCLGRSKGTSLVLYLLLWPVWLVRSILGLVRVRSAIRRLRASGPRDEALAPSSPAGLPPEPTTQGAADL